MGSRFLDLFAAQVNLPITAAARVYQEYSLGVKSGDRGGRIDILITDGTNTIVIENKIYAADQEAQIARYLKSFPSAIVLYLTLGGDNPREQVAETEKARFRCISYKQHIIKWLDACHKEAAHAPLVRETIKQYSNLVKTLTEQNTDSHMSEEITKAILVDSNTLEAYRMLLRNRQEVARKLESQLKIQVQSVADELGLKATFDSDFGSRDKGFYLFNAEMEKRELSVGFAFDGRDHWGFYYGVRFYKSKDPLLHSKIQEVFNQTLQPCKSTDWWPAWLYWEGRDNWWSESDRTFADILDGKFKAELREKILKLVAVVRRATD